MFDLRELALPVICAPMAGGPTTPALAAAVSTAGGLGFLAGGYLTADRLSSDIAAVRETTSAPFGVNLFVVERNDPDPRLIDGYRRSLEPEAERLGVELGEPRWDDDHWQAKLDLLLDARPDLVSFTFGCPGPDVLRRLTEAGIHSCVTVTSVPEALEAMTRGAASLCVQGPLAGGHRGTWSATAAPNPAPLSELLPAVVDAVAIPVIAAGGLAIADDIARCLASGAVASQAGSAFLRADEAGTNSVHRAALTDPGFHRTELTRAYTGRWARGLANRFIAEHVDAPAGYPQLHHLTVPLRRAAVAAGDPQTAQMWAGAARSAALAAPAAEITGSLTP